MKRKIHFSSLKHLFTITLIALMFYTNTNIAQDIDRTECPYFNVITTDTVGVEFPLLSTNVKATISGVIASVEIEQVYQNSGDQEIDATYIFPMSTNAAVYSMQMILDERVIDAEIKEKAEAQQIFDNANANGQTATLLEQQRPNVFQMSLANILPGNILQVKMKYTELIEPEKGIYQFVFPTVVGPRYSTGGEQWVAQSINDSLSVANTALNIDVTINAGMEITAQCTSHNAPITYNGETASCYLETFPEKDFIVDYSLEGNRIETGLLTYEGEDENFFLAMIQPPKAEVEYDSPPREYVFILDVSGSMRGQPIEVSKRMITNLLDDLNEDDRFNILFFAGGNKVYSPNSLPVTTQNINNAIAFIDDVNAGGGTQLLPAMQRALSMQGTADFSRTFVILTDGLVTVEKEAFQLIRENLNEANFFAFGIGGRVNRYIIEGLAYVAEGESFVVTEAEDAQTTADTFKEYIERPALTNITAEFANVNVYDVEPLSIPDVFAERPVIIYGKYDNANNGTVTLAGDYANTQVSRTLNFPDNMANGDENIAIKYLWARKRIQLMSDYGIASNENDAVTIEEEITQLGLDYGLVTEYTSFVAVDTAAVTGIDETNNNNYGYDVSYSPTNFSPGQSGPPGGAPPPAGAPPAPPPPPPPPPAPTTVFTGYPWLSTYVNSNNCNGESVTVYNAGSYNFILIQNGNEGKLYFENGAFYCNETPSYSCVAAYGLTNVAQTWNCGTFNPPNPAPTISGCMDASATNYNASATADDGSCQYANTSSTTFTSYPWLSTYVNQSACNGESITVFNSGSYNFILIQNGNEGKLYFENGTFYCNETPSYSCVNAYGLTNVAQTWACGNNPTQPPVPTTINGCTDASATNFNASATTDDGSCQYATSGNCNSNTGTFFYADCGGTLYYFIRLDNGRIFDPYFADGIEFLPREGQRIHFDYEINREVTTPCTRSESPITITCYESIESSIFDEFQWLNTVLNPNNCNSSTVSLYSGGSYYFVYVESPSGNSLYYQDGTFYCNDCRSLYNLTNADLVWNCGDGSTFKQNQIGIDSNTIEDLDFNIYPNPTTSKVFIDLPDKASYKINLMDISGKVMKQMETELNATTVEVNVSDLAKGIYLVELRNELDSYIQKLVIE